MSDQDIRGSNAIIAEATPWIDGHLARAGIARTGPPGEPRVRTWATVIAIPTDRGTVWFKAASRVTAHEVSLYPLLVAEAPDLVLHPIATDPTRAWMLLPDGGTSLLHAVSGGDLVRRLEGIVPHYAQLQMAMASQVPAILGMGAPDMRPALLTHRFKTALAAAEKLAHDSGATDDIEAMRRVAALHPRFAAWVDTLTAATIQPSIDHSDLHANNMLMPDGPGGLARIYDWGDSVVAHPFSTLLVMLRSLMDQLETTPDDPRLVRVRDAYLEPFSGMTSRAELVEFADAACWTSVVNRALNWVRVLELGPPANPDWGMAPVEWMKTFLNSSWLE